MTNNILEDLKANIPKELVEEIRLSKAKSNIVEIVIKPENLRKIALHLRNLGFNYFIGIETIDWWKKDNTFELIYMFSSIERNGQLVFVRFKIPRDNPVVDSIHDIFPLAYYQEIENYEFFGVVFRNHGGLRKWILEGNWDGPPPLRKDFDSRKWVLEKYYGGKRYERPI